MLATASKTSCVPSMTGAANRVATGEVYFVDLG